MTMLKSIRKVFYNRLRAIIHDRPRQNIAIVIGYFNAKNGSDKGYEDTTGQQGLGKVNDNAEIFVDLCAMSNLGCCFFFITEEYTKRSGYHQMCQKRIRLVMCAS
ncbi:hypothetical protein ACOMHN_027845 [Nucella lapillus]